MTLPKYTKKNLHRTLPYHQTPHCRHRLGRQSLGMDSISVHTLSLQSLEYLRTAECSVCIPHLKLDGLHGQNYRHITENTPYTTCSFVNIFIVVDADLSISYWVWMPPVFALSSSNYWDLCIAQNVWQTSFTCRYIHCMLALLQSNHMIK